MLPENPELFPKGKCNLPLRIVAAAAAGILILLGAIYESSDKPSMTLDVIGLIFAGILLVFLLMI